MMSNHYWIKSRKRQELLGLFAKTPLASIGPDARATHSLWVQAGRPKIWRRMIHVGEHRCLLTVAKASHVRGYSRFGIGRLSRIHITCENESGFIRVMLHEARHIQQDAAIVSKGKDPSDFVVTDSGWKYLFDPFEIDAVATEMAFGFDSQALHRGLGGKSRDDAENELLKAWSACCMKQAKALKRQLTTV